MRLITSILPRLSLGVVSAFILWSCGCKKAVWSEARNFGGNRWLPSETVEFEPDSGYFDNFRPDMAVISLRYGRGCPALRLPVSIETESPASGVYRRDTVYIDLLQGNLRNGDHSKFGVFETVDTIHLSTLPSDGWTMTVSSLADTVLSDIYSLTLQLY